jgi:hypothetical protein
MGLVRFFAAFAAVDTGDSHGPMGQSGHTWSWSRVSRPSALTRVIETFWSG